MTESKVESKMTFAESSCSLSWNSAKDKMITAEGVADSTNKLALKVASKNGKKVTNR